MQVIYGDTDSIMVYTASDDRRAAKELAAKIKKEINKRWARVRARGWLCLSRGRSTQLDRENQQESCIPACLQFGTPCAYRT